MDVKMLVNLAFVSFLGHKRGQDINGAVNHKKSIELGVFVMRFPPLDLGLFVLFLFDDLVHDLF